MNRYEILIGKEPPPEPPEPPKVREILLGKRRSGKTFELIDYIRKTVVKGITPLVCLSHKPDYFLEMLGSLVDHVYLTSAERLGRDYRGLLGDIKVFYYDDFDLVRFRKEDFFDCQRRNSRPSSQLEKYSLDRRFVEMDEIVVTCDIAEMRRYCQISYLDYMPSKIKVGFNTWEVVDISRRSNDMIYTFNQSYRSELTID
jgi:hypothetical protein